MDPSQGDNDSVNDSGFNDQIGSLMLGIDRGDIIEIENNNHQHTYINITNRVEILSSPTLTASDTVVKNPVESKTNDETDHNELPSVQSRRSQIPPPLPQPIIDDFEDTPINIKDVSFLDTLKLFPMKKALKIIGIGLGIGVIVQTSVSVWKALELQIYLNDFWNCSVQNVCKDKEIQSPDVFQRAVVADKKSRYKELPGMVAYPNSIFTSFLKAIGL